MFLKGLILILATTVIAAGLVILRQQRIEHAHAMTQLHRRIDESRQRVWVLQSDIAEHLEPRRLESAISRAQLPLESVTRIDRPVHQPFYLVSQREDGHVR